MPKDDKKNMKATAVAPSNIALIKYWGKKNEELRLPTNGSISVNMSNLLTTTTVEFNRNLSSDEVIINGISDKEKSLRVSRHLDRIRKLAKISTKAKVVSKNMFPTAGGLASSASGLAALTVAAANAANLKLSQKDLTILARVGSGSACRSIPDGYVEWLEGNSNDSSYAVSIFSPDHWKIAIVAIIVEKEKKLISSTQGHDMVRESPFFRSRLKQIKKKITAARKFIKEKNFRKFGELVEREALELHALTLTSSPPIIYWQPETVKLMKLIQSWRKQGLESYFSIDAGPNLFVFSQEKNLPTLLAKLKENKFNDLIVNKPSVGARLTDQHLF